MTTAPAAAASPQGRDLRLPSYPWRFAHLAALWGYGVSQPVFAMLLSNPEFLVINGASRTVAVAFALALAFLPPLAALALQVALRVVSARAADLTHLLCIAFFGFTAFLQLLALLDPVRRIALVAPAVFAYALMVLYARSSTLRAFLSVSVVLPMLGLVVFVTTAPLALADSQGADVRVGSETPVVLLLFDEFPVTSLLRADGSVDAVRYPGFGRLAREGTWYQRATTVDELTARAVPAILTGRVPSGASLPTLADHPRNLFTLLGESYSFRVREPVTRLCPVTYCPDQRSRTPLASRVSGLLHDLGINYLHGSLPRNFHGNLAPLREGWGALIEDTDRGTDEFVATLRPSNPLRTLYFMHAMQPHAPWFALPSGRRYGSEWFVSGLSPDWVPGQYERWRDAEPLLVAQGLQRHLLEVMVLDRFVAQLLDRLDELELYDRALVIVTADHGISFRPGSWKRHADRKNVAEIASVPLFVKYPGQRSGVADDRTATAIDVLPTIADVLRVKLPWPVDGRSLRGRPVDRHVRVGARDSEVVAAADAVAAEVARVARRNAGWLGSGAQSLYRLGPRPDLLGRRAVDLPATVATDATVKLSRASELANVRKSSGYVPAHVIGSLDWDAARPKETLAIAVNGSIAAVTTSFGTGGRTVFSALVDERLLVDGRNTVDVFAIRGAGRGTRLVRLGGTGDPKRALAAKGRSSARER